MKIQDVYDELKIVTDKDTYVTISYEMSRYSSGNEDIECNIYIENKGHFSAPTFRLVLNQAMAAMGLIKPDVLELEA